MHSLHDVGRGNSSSPLHTVCMTENHEASDEWVEHPENTPSESTPTELLERLRKFRGLLPNDFRFDREDANRR